MGKSQNSILRIFLLASSLLLGWKIGYPWGFKAHRFINREATKSLPSPLFAFYSEFAEYLEEHAVDPDKRRYTDTNEASKHYLDLEFYEQQLPIDTIPHFWKNAIEKYGESHLKNFGSLPWQIQWSMFQLKKAFQSSDLKQILQISAELGHYVADAHVPLHTTANYDGQLTNQRGIHALWETKIPDNAMDNYRLIIPKAQFWYSETDTIFTIITESHQLISMILQAEKWINNQIKPQQRYAISTVENTGKPIKKFAEHYLFQCEKAMENSVALRLQLAIHRVASCWYTAWILAGQPNLPIIRDYKFNSKFKAFVHHHKKSVAFPLMRFAPTPSFGNDYAKELYSDSNDIIDSLHHNDSHSDHCHKR
jgi:hypothetical protein